MEETTSTHAATRGNKLERATSFALMAVALLLPIFFIPSSLFSIPFSKSLIAYAGILATLVLFVLSILESGRLRIPTNPVFYTAFFVPVLFFVSALSSSSIQTSLVGYGFETGTFAFILLMFVFLFLVSTVYSTREKVFYSYLLYLVSFGFVVIFQAARLVWPSALSFGVLSSPVSNLIGSWNDLGAFFAISAVLALATLELLPLKKAFTVVLYTALALSLAFLALINFSTLWYLIGAFALAMIVYVAVGRQGEEGDRRHGKRLSYLSVAVLAVSVIFVFAGGFISEQLAGALNVANLEVRPSWVATLDIARHALGENAILGSGPNTFQYQWLQAKPDEINGTAFWNTDFAYGVGLIPTFLVTTGVLGILGWLAFLGSLLYVGSKAIFSGIRDPLSRYLVISSFLASVFLWAMCIVYVPSMSIVALTFFFTGLFVASAYNEDILSTRRVTLYQSSRMGFVTVLVLVFALILSVAAGYFTVKNFVSTAYFQKSLASAVAGDLDGAERSMARAIALREHDVYYRSLSEIKVLRLNSLLTRQDAPVEELRNAFQVTLGEAIQHGLKAVEINPANYQNHVALGRIYEAVVPPPFKIEGAYEKAKESYDKGLERSPKNPEMLLLLSRLEVANGSMDTARDYAQRALQLKPDYVDGYFLLSQIEVASGNLKKAIASVESATFLAPGNAGLYFQLGLLKYNDSDFQGAIGSFERATGVVEDYANAKYFLGLSYHKVGRTADAIKQFEQILTTNPENKEVPVILENLRAGRDPFANMAPPLDNQPEKRENPPVNESR